MAKKADKQKPLLMKDRDMFYTFLVKYGARPSVPGEDWARDNGANLQNVVDRVTSLQTEAKVRSGKGKSIVCAILGASLVAAIEDRLRKHSNETRIIESLENLVKVLQKTNYDLEQQLEKEREENRLLKTTLKAECSKDTEALSVIELEAEGKGIQQINPIYPQKLLKEVRKCFVENPQVRPLIKTGFIAYTITELAKLKREYGRLPKESETEYVWRVSLTGGDQIQLSEKEAGGYWGHGVFLTTGNKHAPWSLTQRAAYWAGGLNPLDRGDPLEITSPADQLLESVHKAACLQLIHERKLIPGCESPMMLPVNPEIMTHLIRGLPESLRPMGVSLRRTIALMCPVERLESFIRSQRNETPDSVSSHQMTSASSNKRIWTWGQVAQELIDYSRKYGPVKIPEEKSRGIRQIEAEDLPLPTGKTVAAADVLRKEHPHHKTGKGGQFMTRQQWWLLGIKKGVPRDIMDGLPFDKLSKPVPTGMNLTLVKQLLQHQDLIKILEKVRENEQKTLITVHHNVEEIHRVLRREISLTKDHDDQKDRRDAAWTWDHRDALDPWW
ncbi:uncharacterized protein LOC129784051 [Falco peregrinus]|uniref:uncharacterized protein LOC129784051 n=1 Tax=Falco peregrinus TaxID=8954 RepID=UPI002479E885|nr:uncharacterized protein LOC129784051 [Falco peregrinus]